MNPPSSGDISILQAMPYVCANIDFDVFTTEVATLVSVKPVFVSNQQKLVGIWIHGGLCRNAAD